jgi:hypothetical protein
MIEIDGDLNGLTATCVPRAGQMRVTFASSEMVAQVDPLRAIYFALLTLSLLGSIFISPTARSICFLLLRERY